MLGKSERSPSQFVSDKLDDAVRTRSELGGSYTGVRGDERVDEKTNRRHTSLSIKYHKVNRFDLHDFDGE